MSVGGEENEVVRVADIKIATTRSEWRLLDVEWWGSNTLFSSTIASRKILLTPCARIHSLIQFLITVSNCKSRICCVVLLWWIHLQKFSLFLFFSFLINTIMLFVLTNSISATYYYRNLCCNAILFLTNKCSNLTTYRVNIFEHFWILGVKMSIIYWCNANCFNCFLLQIFMYFCKI